MFRKTTVTKTTDRELYPVVVTEVDIIAKRLKYISFLEFDQYVKSDHNKTSYEEVCEGLTVTAKVTFVIFKQPIPEEHTFCVQGVMIDFKFKHCQSDI